MFVSNNLKIERLFKDKKVDNLEVVSIDMKANEDLVIPGLGFIKFTKDEKIIIHVLKGCIVYKRK